MPILASKPVRLGLVAGSALAFSLGACRSEPEFAGVRQSTAASLLVGRVWVRSDSTGLPGVMRVFLSDSTLIMDSCWETYRLARWQISSPRSRSLGAC